MRAIARASRSTRGGPRAAGTRAAEELADAMARPELILLRHFPRAHEIPQRFGRRIRHPHRGEIPGPIAARKLRGIFAIRLHAIPRLRRNQARRDHIAMHAERRELPVQRIPGRPSFVADAQRRWPAELRDQLPHGLWAIPNRPHLADTPVRLGDRHRDRFGMDIETHMTHFLWHKRPAPSCCGSGQSACSDWLTHVTTTASRSLHSD